jgi:site-specific DNA recombinase
MNNNNQPTTLLVARVSDVEQRKALPAQKKKLYAYADIKKWKEDVDFKYIEFDETAFKQNRKTFNELVINPLLTSLKPSIVVFDKIDRFSRDSSSDEKAALTRLYESGMLEMHFPSDNLFIHKDSPAADRFRLDIGISLAAYYSSTIRDNVKRRFDQLLNDGVWVHRAPIGYLNTSKIVDQRSVKDIIVDSARSHYVVTAFELRATGMPYSMIAKELLKAGYISPKTNKAQLTKSTVEKMINNSFYYGLMVHNGTSYKHHYEPLVSRALFNRCKLVRDARKSMKNKWDSIDFNLGNIVTCDKCSRSISPFRSKNLVYLKCANPLCTNPNTAESLVMDSIESVVKSIQIPEDLMNKVIVELKNKHDSQQKYYVQSISSIRKEYDDIDKQLEGWFGKLVNNRISPEMHDRIVDALHQKQSDLNDKLDILTNGNKDFHVTASYLLDLVSRIEELYACADEGQRSKLIGFLLSNLKLNDKKLSFTVNYPFDKVIEEKQKAPEGAESLIWCG